MTKPIELEDGRVLIPLELDKDDAQELEQDLRWIHDEAPPEVQDRLVQMMARNFRFGFKYGMRGGAALDAEGLSRELASPVAPKPDPGCGCFGCTMRRKLRRFAREEPS